MFRDKLAEKKTDGDLDGIEVCVNILEKRLKALDDMETLTNTIHANSRKILKEITKFRDAAAEQIDELRNCLEALKSNS